MQSNVRPLNQFKVVYYPAGKPDGLIAGYAVSVDDARKIATERAPATIWNQWNREPGRDGRKHYRAILVDCVAASS